MGQDSTTAGQPIDNAIEALNLAPVAKAAAYDLKRQHPGVVFTSGRRDKTAQARAMASNVIKNRQWIVQTYSPSEICSACQKWVDEHPAALTQGDIQVGLLAVFDTFGDDQMGRLSKHLSGNAFVVQPVSQNAEAIMKTIRGLKGLDKFLEKEGGLVRWHAQFK